MTRVELSASRALSPGDIRQLGSGALVVLRPSVKDRADWQHITPALLTALCRGASVIWEEE